ncbi:periplasmic sensor diguanylate cyclase/phosphodiesterase [Ectocarpus siliculosus]|uniref:Periplasmic sensor diguanylate cyclase/phosphodiesterase n=1 Tax=Ectocarpus siliculosus TaxID=2880 RepID=D7G0S2_ECTSI|nr:periplasmic sensor diguanylate cyclase/phosphodiesterase [Ectocarpus siliculosus]|eukprot:CBJ26735.1 periplasmic sensor diguanylate cyclase/phosphodiesterase [Ectocarpus siliculosus]
MADTEEVRFTYNQEKIVYDVINGNIDVGFVRTDMVQLMDAADLVPEWPLQAFPHVPSDLVKEVVRALMLINETHEAAVSGGYSTWDVPLSYADLRTLQVQLGVLDSEQGHCIQSENVYGAVVCPEGFFKIAENLFDSKCTELGSKYA